MIRFIELKYLLSNYTSYLHIYDSWWKIKTSSTQFLQNLRAKRYKADRIPIVENCSQNNTEQDQTLNFSGKCYNQRKNYHQYIANWRYNPMFFLHCLEMTFGSGQETTCSYVEDLTHRKYYGIGFYIESRKHEHKCYDPWHEETSNRTCQESNDSLLEG